MIRQTHTYADLPVPPWAMQAVREALLNAGPKEDYHDHYWDELNSGRQGFALQGIRLVEEDQTEWHCKDQEHGWKDLPDSPGYWVWDDTDNDRLVVHVFKEGDGLYIHFSCTPHPEAGEEGKKAWLEAAFIGELRVTVLNVKTCLGRFRKLEL